MKAMDSTPSFVSQVLLQTRRAPKLVSLSVMETPTSAQHSFKSKLRLGTIRSLEVYASSLELSSCSSVFWVSCRSFSACFLACLLASSTKVSQYQLFRHTKSNNPNATNINGYIAIVIGAGITMIVQSSSITTSTLTPLVGMGALRLEQMLPLTLGANIGTTMTALLASLVSNSKESLQVALAHLFFNISGIVLFYPLPITRNIPLNAARRLGQATRIWHGFPILYIAVMFFAVPAVFLGISFLFEQKTVGFTVLGSFVLVVVVLMAGYFAFYCLYRGGKQDCVDCMERREERRQANMELPEDMKFLKEKVHLLLTLDSLTPKKTTRKRCWMTTKTT